jgi:hypothetical protein
MQDTYRLCKHLLTASVLVLAGQQIDAFSTKMRYARNHSIRTRWRA